MIAFWTAGRQRRKARADLEAAAARMVTLWQLQQRLDAGVLERGRSITAAAACSASMTLAQEDMRHALHRLGVPLPNIESTRALVLRLEIGRGAAGGRAA